MQDIEKQVSNPDIKQKLKEIIEELYAKTYTKIKLLDVQNKENQENELMFHVGNIKGGDTVPLLIGKLNSLKNFHWDLKIVFSNNLLSRILKPEIWMHFDWEEGGSFSCCLTLEQFQTIRKAIATMVLRIHAIECIKQIDL